MTNKNFEQVAKELKEVINNSEMQVFFGTGYAEYSRRTAMAMIEDINKAQDGKEVMVDSRVTADVKAVLHDTTNMLILKDHSDFSMDFISLYCLLVQNWNKLAKDSIIVQTLESIQKLRNYNNSVSAMVSVMRRLIDKTESVLKTQNPSYLVSSHYLKSINDAISK